MLSSQNLNGRYEKNKKNALLHACMYLDFYKVIGQFFEKFEIHPCLFATKQKFYSNKHGNGVVLSKI